MVGHHGLAIECTRKAVNEELDRLRAVPAYGWLRSALTVWTCRRIVRQMFAARDNAFAGHTRSACTTQLRIACADGSNSRAKSSGVRPARTSSIIWRRYSGAYGGLDLGMMDTSFPKDQVSTKADQLQHVWVRSRPSEVQRAAEFAIDGSWCCVRRDDVLVYPRALLRLCATVVGP